MEKIPMNNGYLLKSSEGFILTNGIVTTTLAVVTVSEVNSYKEIPYVEQEEDYNKKDNNSSFELTSTKDNIINILEKNINIIITKGFYSKAYKGCNKFYSCSIEDQSNIQTLNQLASNKEVILMKKQLGVELVALEEELLVTPLPYKAQGELECVEYSISEIKLLFCDMSIHIRNILNKYGEMKKEILGCDTLEKLELMRIKAENLLNL